MTSNFIYDILPIKSGVYKIRLESMREFDTFAFAYFDVECGRWGIACRTREMALLQKLSVHDRSAEQRKGWEDETT